MPIYIEKPQPQELTAEDIADIEKIYADYPAADALNRIDAWKSGNLADRQLVLARFNDRLLGALWLQSNDDQDLIHDICVRKITRGRGVGRRLVDHVMRTSKARNQKAQLAHEPQDPKAKAILEHLLANPSPFNAQY